jgi:hypothetical protein
MLWRMQHALSQRFEIFREFAQRRWVRVLGAVWFLSGVWDLALSQWLPPELANRLPKLYQVIALAAGLLSWQLWAIVGAAIFSVGALEYAVARKNSHPADPQAEALTSTSIGSRTVVALALIAMLGLGIWYVASLPRGAPKSEVIAHRGSKPLTGARLQSTNGKVLLTCAVPRGDQKEAEETKAAVRKHMQIYGDALGLAVALSDIADGMRLDIRAKTPEGQLRLGAITKVAIQMQRTGGAILVIYSWEMPGLLGSLFNSIPLDGSSDQAAQAVGQVEQMLGPTAKNKCHIL